jgi:hypothetical protein
MAWFQWRSVPESGSNALAGQPGSWLSPGGTPVDPRVPDAICQQTDVAASGALHSTSQRSAVISPIAWQSQEPSCPQISVVRPEELLRTKLSFGSAW